MKYITRKEAEDYFFSDITIWVNDDTPNLKQESDGECTNIYPISLSSGYTAEEFQQLFNNERITFYL